MVSFCEIRRASGVEYSEFVVKGVTYMESKGEEKTRSIVKHERISEVLTKPTIEGVIPTSRSMSSKASLSAELEIIESFKGKRILVLGDLMVDHYIFGEATRISPEAPVPIIDVLSQDFRLGGSANVVNCIVDMGGNPIPVGVVGDDDYGRWIDDELKRKGIDESCLLVCQDRPTTTKTRVMVRGQQLMRIDREKKDPINSSLRRRILGFVESELANTDGVIISDYEKGVVTVQVLKELIPLSRKYSECIVADARARNMIHYRDITVLRTNTPYSSIVTGITPINETSLRNVGLKLLTQLQCEAVVITRGKEGMSIFEKSGRVAHISATKNIARDITGAGDVITSTLTLALAGGANKIDAARLANYAAGIKVGKLGTATVTIDELETWLRANEKGLVNY